MSKKRSLDEILKESLEHCEIVVDVIFFGKARYQSYVAVFDKPTLRHLQCSTQSCKIVLQKDLIKKGIKEVPIYEYGSNTQEKLLKSKKHKLKKENSELTKKILKEAKN